MGTYCACVPEGSADYGCNGSSHLVCDGDIIAFLALSLALASKVDGQ